MGQGVSPLRAPRFAPVALLVALALTGCRVPAPYVWVDDFKEPAPPLGEYLIQAGDVLHVRVLNQDSVTSRVKVRRDGLISMPVIGEVQCVGLTSAALADQIQAKLAQYFQSPSVVVSVEETRPLQISVIGEVIKPGVFVLDPGQGVLEALALAGGLTPFAERDWVVVLRRLPGEENPTRIRFDYGKVSAGRGRGAAFRLAPGDVIVVE